METRKEAALPEERPMAATPEEDIPVTVPRIRLRAILDMLIVGLMIAILLTLSLPVCMAVVEQKQAEMDAQKPQTERLQRHSLDTFRSSL